MDARTVSKTPPRPLPGVAAVLVLCMGMGLPQQGQGQGLDFATHCMRVQGQGLVLDTSPACVNAFRTQPAARAQFVHAIQETMAHGAASAEGRVVPSPPNAAARSLKRLHERASSEAGAWAGGGAPYYGAHP